MDLAEFNDMLEKHRVDAVERLVKKYRTISPLLGKVCVSTRLLGRAQRVGCAGVFSAGALLFWSLIQ